MADLTLDVARKILDTALAKGVEKKLKPLVVTVLDARGCVKISAAQDGTSLLRSEIAHGKAYGALAMGMGSRALFQRAQEQAYFISAVNTMAQGRMVPVPGGVLIQDGGVLLGAVGVSGDTSDNDEICAIAGIEAAGLKGCRIGSAHVSEKHANFIQSDKGGRAGDVWALIAHVREVVLERRGVALSTEVRLLGFPDGENGAMVRGEGNDDA